VSKSKIWLEKIIKYLRELSIVVIGVAITLSASYWITSMNEKRDMQLYLNAIKLEMKDNIELVNILIGELEQSVGYADYLWSHDKKSLNIDSIQSYKCYYYVSVFAYQCDAFEMFKSLGFMRLMEDKSLLRDIWSVYNKLDELQAALELSNQIKLEEIKKEIFLDKKKDFIPMYQFYTSTRIPYNMYNEYKKLLDTLNRMVEIL
jgi:hypothetical protein